jgi:allantoin racemase
VKIILVNVNTSESMTEVIAAGARKYASPGTQTVALRPFFGPEAVDCNFESYLSAVGVMDRVLAYDEPYDAVVLAGFGEHGRDGLQELIEQPVIEICEASAYMAMLIARTYSVVTTLQRSVAAIEDRLRLAGVADRCASVRASGMSTLDIDADPQGAIRGIVEEARIAEAVVGLGLQTSKLCTYAAPEPKVIAGWPLSRPLGSHGKTDTRQAGSRS